MFKLFAGLGSVRVVENCDLGLEMLLSACSLMQHFQDLGHSFLLYETPSRQIKYVLVWI